MRKCKCSGACQPSSSALDRREFLALAGAGTAGAILGAANWTPSANAGETLDEWKRALQGVSSPRLYRADIHMDARMHLGGIGTGNFEIGADGQFTTWQLFNTLSDGEVPFHFGIKTGAIVRLLQTAGGPPAPRIRQIEMTGEYPVAILRFQDPELPVKLELTAFSPFSPLDTALSSTPLAVFLFRLSNPGSQPQEVSLGAFLQNPVGYEAIGPLDGVHHPDLGGNVNECFREGRATGLLMRAEAAAEPVLDRPVHLYSNSALDHLDSPSPARPALLTVEPIDRLLSASGKLTDPAHTVIWIEDAPDDFPEPVLRAAYEAVQAGAVLFFSGKTQALLAAYAKASKGQPMGEATGRPDVLFEDFESGYDRWTVEGAAFGPKPAAGTLPGQQAVSGFAGRGLVNTFIDGDAPVGRLISKTFSIERNYIRFLLGGGSNQNTQIRLIVGDKTVRATSGSDREKLLPASWDVHELQGQTAHIEIVDDNTGAWGHVNVDQIEFADQPASHALLRLLDEILPARFDTVRASTHTSPHDPNRVEFDRLQPHSDTQGSSTPEGLRLWVRPIGQGKVAMAAGPVLKAEEAGLRRPRQRAFARVCALVGANCSLPIGTPPSAPGFGTMALATLTGEASANCALASPAAAWTEFASQGRFLPAGEAVASAPTPSETTAVGALATTVTVPPGGTIEVPFLLTWRFPNKYNAAGVTMGCHYATRWPDARAVLREATGNFDKWCEVTERFRKTFYNSTLPYWLLDCLTSQAAIIRHIGVVFRIANGDVYGWEGSNGCCQPTCTHVWGYEQTLARLFPDLEKEMRRIDFTHQQLENGGVNNRTDVPSPPHPTGEQPFADGHASCILKAWREALNHPDDSWLKQYWPHIKRAVEYLIARDAAGSGGSPDGTLKDDQWNTYDEALHGVTTFIGTYYLAALRAGEEWGRRMGDNATADRFHAVFEKGQERLIALCWNGDYFQQHLPDYLGRPGEVGPGCMSDQLIGQWWAHQLGLGYLLPREKVQSALRAVFKHNWKADLTGWKHVPRAFAGDRDKGLIICTWPLGGRPANVMLYSDEVWTGIEYQAAAHMIYEGMVEEGLAIAKGARDRYDGMPRAPIQRNPWNEIECGGHYARAMSSWSLLLALSGYEYDGPNKTLRFTPRSSKDQFKSFFCGPEGWGSLRQTRNGASQQNEVIVVQGRMALSRLHLAAPRTPGKVQATLGTKPVECTLKAESEAAEVVFESPVVVKPGEALSVSLS